MRRPVLVVIDMLNDFLEKWAPARRQQLVQSINNIIGFMRKHDRPIIWVRQEFEPALRDAFAEMRTKGIRITIKGTAGCQITPDLAVAPADPVVIKKRYSAFYRTNLDRLLNEVPVWLFLISEALVLGGLLLVFWVVKVNRFASRTVEVEAGQTVISSGPMRWFPRPDVFRQSANMALRALGLGLVRGLARIHAPHPFLRFPVAQGGESPSPRVAGLSRILPSNPLPARPLVW